MQPRASTAVAQRAALALAERALRDGLPPGLDGYQALLRCLEQGRVVEDATSVLVDQADRVKNPHSASARLVRALRTRYLLLLTATPVENRLDDLFQLVNLVRPGQLGTPKEFRARTGPAKTSAEPARNMADLQARLREGMVRHRRSERASMLPRRLGETLCVQPGAEE